MSEMINASQTLLKNVFQLIADRREATGTLTPKNKSTQCEIVLTVFSHVVTH